MATGSSCQFAHRRFRLLQPELHVDFAVHRHRGDNMPMRLVALAAASVESPEAEVAYCP